VGTKPSSHREKKMRLISYEELVEAVERDVERQEAEKAPEPVNTPNPAQEETV
jgi:hypothetical protein